MNPFGTVHLFLLTLGLALGASRELAGADADAVTVAALRAGVAQRQDAYRNLKFVLSVKSEAAPDPPVESRDTFKIMESNRKEVSRPWRCWERLVRDNKGQWETDQFAAGDGAQFRVLGPVPSTPDEHRWHPGVVRAGEDWTEYRTNVFDAFLFINFDGLVRYMDPTGEFSRQMNRRFTIQERKKSLGRDVFVLFNPGDPQFGVAYRVEVTGEPDFIILRLQALLIKEGHRPAEEYEVTEIKTFQSVAYPAAGRYRQDPPEATPGLTDKFRVVSYEFSVVSVEALSEDARKDWFPQWPAGTQIVDQISGRNQTIPPKIVEMSNEQLGAAARARGVELGEGASPARLRRVLVAICVVVVVVAVWYLRRARRARAGTG